MKNQAEMTHSLLADLEHFKSLKSARWEAVEDSIQMSNYLGTPTEDWIIPPDESQVRKVLEEDPDYVFLRKSILEKVPLVKKEIEEVGFDTRHKLDWLKFTDPLIGTSAIEDAIDCLNRFLRIS